MRNTALAKRGLLNCPSAFPPRKIHPESAPAGLIQQSVKAKILSSAPEHSFLRHAHELLASAVHDTQALLRIEGEHRHVNLHQHFLQERNRLHRSQALALQSVGERVDLKNKFAESIVAAGATSPKREVLFAQSGDHVGEGLQRTHDLRPQSKAADQPREDEEKRYCPSGLRRIVAQPEHQLTNTQ